MFSIGGNQNHEMSLQDRELQVLNEQRQQNGTILKVSFFFFFLFFFSFFFFLFFFFSFLLFF